MPRKTPKGSNKQIIKWKSKKTIDKFWRGVLSALLASGSMWLAGKGLDFDLASFFNSPEVVNGLTSLTLCLLYGAIEAARNYGKHKLGRELF